MRLDLEESGGQNLVPGLLEGWMQEAGWRKRGALRCAVQIHESVPLLRPCQQHPGLTKPVCVRVHLLRCPYELEDVRFWHSEQTKKVSAHIIPFLLITTKALMLFPVHGRITLTPD